MIQFSFVVPIYNDASLAADFCTEFQATFSNYLKKDDINEDVELIFVNDGSTNDSIHILKLLMWICKILPIKFRS